MFTMLMHTKSRLTLQDCRRKGQAISSRMFRAQETEPEVPGNARTWEFGDMSMCVYNTLSKCSDVRRETIDLTPISKVSLNT